MVEWYPEGHKLEELQWIRLGSNDSRALLTGGMRKMASADWINPPSITFLCFFLQDLNLLSVTQELCMLCTLTTL